MTTTTKKVFTSDSWNEFTTGIANLKAKVDYTNIAFGTCDTAAATAAKVVTISGNPNWQLTTGAMITVKFTNTNTAANATLNVNGTGAKSIYYNNAVYTSGSSYAGYAKRSITYQYDGTYWVFVSWSYDSNSDTKVTQASATTAAVEYPVILGYSASTASVTNTVNKADSLKYNPNTKILTVPTVKGNLTGLATSATVATSATYSTSAGSASKATSATSATYATTATNAGTATYAKNAGTSNYTKNAGTSNYASSSGISLTQAEYDALVTAGTVNSNITYYITDSDSYVTGWRIEQVTALPSDAGTKINTMYVVG